MAVAHNAAALFTGGTIPESSVRIAGEDTANE